MSLRSPYLLEGEGHVGEQGSLSRSPALTRIERSQRVSGVVARGQDGKKARACAYVRGKKSRERERGDQVHA
jgi:hypothetical protein